MGKHRKYKKEVHTINQGMKEQTQTINQIKIFENYIPNELNMSEVRCKYFYSKYVKDTEQYDVIPMSYEGFRDIVVMIGFTIL